MKNVIILLYHDIDSQNNPTEKRDLATRETVVRLEEFENHIKYLASEGYRVLSVKQYLDKQRKGENEQDRDIVLTFDDGFKNVIENAYPIMKNGQF